MRAVLPVVVLLAAGAVMAAPRPKPLTAAQKAKLVQAKKAKAAAQAKAAAAKRARATAGTQNLGSRGSVIPRPGVRSPDQIGEPFPSMPPRAGGSELPAARVTGLPLFFRTASDYDVRLDLKPDFVAVQRPGAAWEELDRPLSSWRAAGWPAYRLLSLTRDPGAFFIGGKADGAPHPDLQAVDASGAPVSDSVTAGPLWVGHLKEQIRRGFEAGSDGFLLADTAGASGRAASPAFRSLFQEATGAAWKDPETPALYFQTSRVRSDQALNAVNELIRFSRDTAREKGRTTRFVVALPSPLDAAETGRIFPSAAVSRLPVDGVVGEVSLGAANRPLTVEGKEAPYPFEYSWLTFSYFANLMDGLSDRALYLSATAAESDTSRSWADYERDYRSALAAALCFPQARGFEAVPWPEMTHSNREGAPAPPAYLTQLSNLAAVMKDIPSDLPEWTGGTRGIGILTLDTLGWQRGGPAGSTPDSLTGLALPLLKRGIPVQLVPAERVADNGFLSRFKILMLSYEAQKPLGPEVNQSLAQWVRGGGTLVLFGGEDPYNGAGEWWEKNGFPTPTDHLLRQCGAGVDLIQRGVRKPASPFKQVLEATPLIQEPKVHVLLLRSEVEAGKPVYLQFRDRTPGNGAGLALRRVRVLEGEKVRADFTAGGAAERPFIVEESGTTVRDGTRSASGSSSFLYRFHRLGPEARLELELGGDFSVGLASGSDPGAVLKPVLGQLPAVRVGSAHPLVTYPLLGAQPLYTTGETGSESTLVWASASGLGTVVYCGVPAAFGAESVAGAELVRSLVRYAAGRAGVEWAEAPLIVRRGTYVIARSFGRTATLPGLYLDLFKPDFPLVQDPQLPYREPGLYRQVRFSTRIPSLVFASHRARTLESNAARTRLVLEGPANTEGFLRVFPAGMSLTGVEARATDGRFIPVQVRPDGRTLKIKYPQQPRGLNLTLRWIRPEARLTK